METATEPFLWSDIFTSNSSEVQLIDSKENRRPGATDDPFYKESEYANNNSRFNNRTETEDIFSGYPFELLHLGAICLIAFAVFGVMGNFISVVALSRCKRLRNATIAFIVNLGVSDLLFCSFTMPLTAMQFLKGSRYLSEGLCKLFPVLLSSNGIVSLFSVVAITVNRYILVVHPRIYPSAYNKLNTAIMIVLIWLIPFLLLMFPLLEIWGKLGYDPNELICTILTLNDQSPKKFLFIVAFGLPFICFPACYTRIFFAVRKASKNVKRHSEIADNYTSNRNRKELRVLRIMLVMFVLYFACFSPFFFIKVFDKENDFKWLSVMGYISAYFTSIINPVIYVVLSKEYRKAYKELFCH